MVMYGRTFSQMPWIDSECTATEGYEQYAQLHNGSKVAY
jgi:hypothetical protein